ncbi:Plant peroxidase [Salix suchowensis]|nr:Plant peroxidase [Salix suchowensis]
MMGSGVPYGYNYGGGSSFSSSNLSPLAPPFTVDRSVAKPLLDLSEPTYPVSLNPSIHNWVSCNSHTPNSRNDLFPIPNLEFDSIQSPNVFGYSSPTPQVPSKSHPLALASADAVLYGQSNPSLVEAGPYYPSSYVSPAIGSDGPLKIPHQSGYELLSNSYSLGLEHATQWSGLWEGVTDWNQSKKLQLDGGFCEEQNFINQGILVSLFCFVITENQKLTFSYISLIATTCRVSAFKHVSKSEETSLGIDMDGRQMHTGSASKGQLDYKAFLVEKPKSMPTTPPMLIFPPAPQAYPQVSSSNVVNSPNTQMLHRNASSNDRLPMMKPSPAVVIRPLGQDTYSSKNLNTGTDGDEKDFAGNNPSFVQEPNPLISSEGKVCYDSSQINFHLKQNDDSFTEIPSKNHEELPSNKNISIDFLDKLIREKMENRAPCKKLDFFNLAMDGHEAAGSVEIISESLDHYNPAVDSPCWKGAPVSLPSAFKGYEVMNPQNKVEACNGLNLQGPQISSSTNDDAVNTALRNKSLEHRPASSIKRPLVANVLFREGIADAMKYGPSQRKSSYCNEAQVSDVFDEPRKESILPDFKNVHAKQRSLEESEWPSKKNSDVADGRRKINDDPDDCSSHVPFHAIEQHTQTQVGESSSKMHARTLVNTMHNLSELLLFYSSNDTCELKDEDFDDLKDVINNLDIFISKNSERKNSTQESLIHRQATSQSPGKLSEPYKGHKIVSDERKEKLSNLFPMRGAADTVNDDNLTQALKKVLAQNFPIKEESKSQILLYKNLWLEAEASLCLVNCTARFNRLQLEIEKGSSQNVKAPVVPGNSMIMENLSRPKVSSDMLPAEDEVSPAHNVPDSSILSRNSHSDDVMARVNIIRSRFDESNSLNTSPVENLSSPEVSPDLNKVDKMAHDTKDSSKSNISFQDSIRGASSHADNAMDRFRILKCRVDNSSSVNTSTGGVLASSLVSPDQNQVDKLARDTKDSIKSYTIQDSPMSGRSGHPDDVMSRFHILNGRDDNSNSVNISAVEKLSCSKVSSDLNRVSKLTDDTKDSIKADVTNQDSPMSSASSQAEVVEASVILKHRDGNSSFLDMEEHQLESIDYGYMDLVRLARMGKDGSKDRTLDVNMEPLIPNYPADSTEDKSTVKEFRLFINDDVETQPRLTNRFGDQTHAGWYDSCSSDWEHVLKEELAGQGY